MLPNVYTEDDIGAAELYVYVGDNQAAISRPSPPPFGATSRGGRRGKVMAEPTPEITILFGPIRTLADPRPHCIGVFRP